MPMSILTNPENTGTMNLTLLNGGEFYLYIYLLHNYLYAYIGGRYVFYFNVKHLL